jgi:hypothetical protein
MTQAKTSIWYNLVVRDQAFVFADPDAVWMSKYVIPHIQFNIKYSRADLMLSQEQFENEIHHCTGFFYAKATQYTKWLFWRCLQDQRKNLENSIDQYVLRDILRENNNADRRVEALDQFLYANGNVFFHRNMTVDHSLYGIEPMIVHANYMIGLEEKTNALKNRNVWYIDE